MTTSQQIVAAVNDARAANRQLKICGNGSKRRHLPAVEGDLLVVNEYSGVVQYDPAELVVTAKAGTPIRQVAAELAQSGQCFAFEPPLFFDDGTIGGMVAAGFSGPARPWLGSVRDAVLGVELVNGLGEQLHFGGQVMKNVAGYDVSRLTAGAFGALGVLLAVSLRVQPVREHVITQVLTQDAAQAIQTCRQLAQQYLPISATWWQDNHLHVRLSGSEAAVLQTSRELGGRQVHDPHFWTQVRDQTHDFFKLSVPGGLDRSDQTLWRIVVPPAAQLPQVPEADLAIEWAGGQRWVWHHDDAFVHSYAQQHKGWAWAVGRTLLLDAVQQKYMRAIKQAFDPEDVFLSPLPIGPDHAD